MLYFSYPQIVLQEVPDEISLALSISGCPLRCKDCHSQETYDLKFGEKLTCKKMIELLKQNKHISCVLFYGGSWNTDYLLMLITIIKKFNKNVCLYTGYEKDDLSKKLIENLDYLKTGCYIKELGGLESLTTNQRMINVKTNDDITYKFQRGNNDKTKPNSN